jgi:hypothetical protein
MANIGGVYETPKLASQPGPVYAVVPLERQKEALDFLHRHVFTTPTWLLDTMILARTGQSPTDSIGRSQDRVLDYLFSTSTVSKLAANQAMYGDKAYSLIDYFNDVDKMMWTELKAEQPIDIYRRNLQRSYIEALISLSTKSGDEYRDVGPIVMNKLEQIHAVVKKAIKKIDDPMSQYHLKFIEARLADVTEK